MSNSLRSPLNILAGWTLIGWVGLLVWALVVTRPAVGNERERSPHLEVRRTHAADPASGAAIAADCKREFASGDPERMRRDRKSVV